MANMHSISSWAARLPSTPAMHDANVKPLFFPSPMFWLPERLTLRIQLPVPSTTENHRTQNTGSSPARVRSDLPTSLPELQHPAARNQTTETMDVSQTPKSAQSVNSTASA